MIDQNLLSYIKSQRLQNINDESIKAALISSGWNQSVINEAFSSMGNEATPASTDTQIEISDKIYPIQNKLVVKQVIPIVILIMLLMLGEPSDPEVASYIFIYILIFIGTIVYFFLAKANYKYEFQEKHIVLHQGILRKQQRTLQYGVIQNVLVKQGLLDRIFGIATLILENAAGKGDLGYQKVFGMRVKTQQQRGDLLGFKGNQISIPGLNKADAEKLKEILLKKIQENPIEDKQSGL